MPVLLTQRNAVTIADEEHRTQCAKFAHNVTDLASS